MSLIHEALEKIELEKKDPWRKILTPPAERISSAAVPAAVRAPHKIQIPYVIGGGLLVLLISGLAYFAFHLPVETDGKKIEIISSQPTASWHGKEFALTGVTRVGSDWTAIVNNELVRVGTKIEGALVEEISQEHVILKFRGNRVALSLYKESGAHFTRLEPGS